MTIHISPFTDCNLGCTYCYEEPDREVKGPDQVRAEYDLDAIFEQLESWKEKYPNTLPGLHGGEPTLMDPDDLEAIYAWIDENYDREDIARKKDNGQSEQQEFDPESSHIQTNGTLLTERHVEIFKEYNVHVGMSVDGPEELNDDRKGRGGTQKTTRKMTERTHENLKMLVESHLNPGIIVVLHKGNAGTDEKLEKLLDWMDWLTRNGVSGHFNPAIPYEDVQDERSLSPERLKEVYLETYEWMIEEDYRRWNPMRQYRTNLMGGKRGNCVNNKCDVYNAGAAKIVKGTGETTGCGKTWSTVGDGVSFMQGETTGEEFNDNEQRYDILKQKPGPYSEEVQSGEVPDQGGCKGCKFWDVCLGGCPSSGMRFDYRNRTLWCKAKYALYDRVDKDIKLNTEILTLTDYPWYLELSKRIARRQVDVRVGVPGNVKEEVTNLVDQIQLSPAERKKIYESVFDERIVSVQESGVHADSSVLDDEERMSDEEERTMTPYAEAEDTMGTSTQPTDD